MVKCLLCCLKVTGNCCLQSFIDYDANSWGEEIVRLTTSKGIVTEETTVHFCFSNHPLAWNKFFS